MKPTEVIGSWEEQKEKLKARFRNLTDKDLQYLPGKSEAMFDNLQVKLHATKRELVTIIEELH